MHREILINGRFAWRELTGVERYAGEITRQLGEAVRLVEPPNGWRGPGGNLWEQFGLPPQVGRGALLWSPANSGPLSLGDQVVTIHDLAPLVHPEWYAASFAAWYRFLIPPLARRVRRVITDSHFSREQILERFSLNDDRVIAIHPGVSCERFHPVQGAEVERVRQRFTIYHPYLLFVGTLQPRKNLGRLLRAWEALHPHRIEAELLLVGGTSPNFRDASLGMLPPGVRLLGRLTDRDLRALYAGSLGVVNPSLYEGFCLTGLEALYCGAAPVVSDIPAFGEALGNAALYFDPNSVEAIAAVLQRFISDELLRKRLVAAGQARFEAYSLERCARLVRSTLNEA
jgi:glycosyltransferase involved in cell wall biosynthesis